MKQNISGTYADLVKQSHLIRQNSVAASKYNIQVGHCSKSVGAVAVTEEFQRLLPDEISVTTSGCDGSCFNSPQVTLMDHSGIEKHFHRVKPADVEKIVSGTLAPSSYEKQFFSLQHRIVLDGCGNTNPYDIHEYISNGGYSALAQALLMSPEEIIDIIENSELRGRGGAYFPVALKWKSALQTDKTPRYLVVNCEEGEPGIFKDRHLMEGVPHKIIEGITIAAYASGASKAYIYINAEANLSNDRMSTALEHAIGNGILGNNILQSNFNLDIEIRRGAGGYVCGEETTLINTIEGDRREPRLRPPFPTESGIMGNPTVINNPETLSSIPFIIRNGPDKFKNIGLASDSGTKIISLSGPVNRPGVIEVPMGTTLREIIYKIGGGLRKDSELKAVAVGGPSSGILPPSELETGIKPGQLHESGVILGAGGIIVLSNGTSILETMRILAQYNASESCGKCTPCREGTPRMVDFIDKLSGSNGSINDISEIKILATLINASSLCGLGQAAGNPVLSTLRFFEEEVAEFVKQI